jgi:5-methyltetrahydrofolate--homocysteine methyltransferase
MGTRNAVLDEIYDAVLQGKRLEIEALVRKALTEGAAPADIIENALRPAMDEVGDRFSRAEAFLPDLILASDATKLAIDYLRPMLGAEGVATRQETIVIGTAQGDMHDIGKNLVIATLEGTGYRVIDLGVDVPAERFVEAVREYRPAVVGLSALLTTTMINIPKTIDALTEAGLREGCLLAVGGAPVTRRNADQWGAEIYAADAGTAAKMITARLASR